MSVLHVGHRSVTEGSGRGKCPFDGIGPVGFRVEGAARLTVEGPGRGLQRGTVSRVYTTGSGRPVVSREYSGVPSKTGPEGRRSRLSGVTPKKTTTKNSKNKKSFRKRRLSPF